MAITIAIMIIWGKLFSILNIHRDFYFYCEWDAFFILNWGHLILVMWQTSLKVCEKVHQLKLIWHYKGA